MQLTTIKGIKTPSEAYKVGVNAFMKKSRTDTNEAINMINTGIRISSGTIFLIKEIVTLERAITASTAMLIPIALSILVEMAKTGHNPSSATRI
jgi:hypothetical protein